MAGTALGVLAASWGVVMALSPILQIRRIVRRRSSDDVSVGYLVVVTVGFGIWIAYGAAIENLTLIVPNTVALLVGVTAIVVALRFRSPDRGPDRGDRRRDEVSAMGDGSQTGLASATDVSR